jgi:hypothetical protein
MFNGRLLMIYQRHKQAMFEALIVFSLHPVIEKIEMEYHQQQQNLFCGTNLTQNRLNTYRTQSIL